MKENREFLHERARLVSALGAMTDGGIVENCVHVGATKFLETGSGIDLALCGYPVDTVADTLKRLGYLPHTETSDAPVQRFVHETGVFQLDVMESGSDAWNNYLVVRDYLLHDATARHEYTVTHAAWSDDTAQREKFFDVILPRAKKWWIDFYGFAPVQKLAVELSELQMPWHVASGWALDLYMGNVTRVHHDLDLQIAYADQLSLREYLAARGWKFVTPFENKLEVWKAHLRLEPPRHQIHAHRDGVFLDILLSDIRGGVWTYRREPLITASMQHVTMASATGIPIIAPEIVLLFKSRNTSNKPRPTDQQDFEMALPHLEPARQAWLRWALLATNPAHPWLEVLA